MGKQRETQSLRGKRVAFAGRFASITRDEAAELAANAGAVPVPRAGDDTAFVVVGDETWPVRDDGRIADNLERAYRLRQGGAAVEVIGESDFLERLGLKAEAPSPTGHEYTTTQLSRILKLPRRRIRAWIRRGLIAPARTEHRIDYFDFRQVAELKRLAELADNGVTVDTIRESLRLLATWFPDTESAIARLDGLEGENGLLVRLGGQLAEPTGQLRLFDPASADPEDTDESTATVVPLPEDPGPDPPPSRELARAIDPDRKIVPFPTHRSSAARDWANTRGDDTDAATGDSGATIQESREAPRHTADEWFEVALEYEEAEKPEEAARAYRNALLVGGPSSEVAFNLGNVLYSLGRWEEALSRFQQAVEVDPDYAEAWNNLASVHAQFEEWSDAIDAGHHALELAPDFADAHYNLAEAYHASGHPDDALQHARLYLLTDPLSPWAQRLKQNLGLA